MKLRVTEILSINRRHWLVLIASALSACGGGGVGISVGGVTGGGANSGGNVPNTGGGTDLASLPGTGGTGIVAEGSISGFGSVILNGIKFDDTQVSAARAVLVDGDSVTSAELRLGMVATVRGERSAAAPTTGTATSIEVWSAARGTVSDLSDLSVNKLAGTFSIDGMKIRTTTNTVLDAINAAAPWSNGMSVMVWGLQATSDASTWTATRVARVAASPERVLSGMVNVEDDGVYLGDLLLTGAAIAGLKQGALVRVQGTLMSAHHLAVNSLKVLANTAIAPSAGSEITLEGYVSAALTNGRFGLGQWVVEVSGLSDTAQIVVGAEVSVTGTYQNKVMQARTLNVLDEQESKLVEIEARIESFASVANFVLRGQRCDASGASMKSGVAQRLAVGLKVKVQGTRAGDMLRVQTLEADL